MKEDANGFARGTTRESVVNGFLPEFHSKGSNRRVRDELRETNKLKVEGTESSVGVLYWRGDEAANEMSIIVAVSKKCQIRLFKNIVHLTVTVSSSIFLQIQHQHL